MNTHERKVHNAIYKLISPDKPAIIMPRKAEGDKKFLTKLINDANTETKKSLAVLVKRKHFKKEEATEILVALKTISKIIKKPNCNVAVFAELKGTDFYLHSVAVST